MSTGNAPPPDGETAPRHPSSGTGGEGRNDAQATAGDRPPATPAPATARPTLAGHVAARRYLRRIAEPPGAVAESVVLHDTRASGVVVLGRREWALLRCADGTRDAAGIRWAAQRRGVRVSATDLDEFFGALAGAGLLQTENAATEPRDSPGASSSDDPSWGPPRPDVPLVPLPGFLLRCDGKGSCCRMFGSTLFSPAEATRAAGLCPDATLRGWGPEPMFTPVSGSTYRLDGGAERARCVATIDGACAYLDTDGRCVLHAAAGPLGKPLGCRSFPRELVDDGDRVHVSVAPECACVMRSLTGPPGEPLLAATVRTTADLDPAMLVRRLREPVEVVAGQPVPTARYLQWARSLARWIAPQWQSRDSCRAGNILGWLWGSAHQLERRADLVDVSGFDHVRAPTADELAPSLRALERDLDARLEQWDGWRGTDDLSLSTARWIRAALDWLAQTPERWPLEASPAVRQREAFCLHAWLHGHRLAAGNPIAWALRDVAVRTLLARTMTTHVFAPSAEGPILEVCDEPLALVHAWFRAHGAAAFVAGPGADGSAQAGPAPRG